ncbi:MAG: hypothetical protein A2Y10_13105 [Planctomycetes bacterium GWF2_41_51]|nr:MAG: hypothetical protein A2Y10_13105 [Planctomycetes bacterium GWF2_41_51]HBG60705.1 hypothetical protein [Candidatus Omnitrophota bacterium]
MMNIEKIAAKLKTLIPDRIPYWLKTRELADPELKSLIEKQIISTAYKTFGDFHDKILLSLPPENKSNGSLNFGTILYDKEKHPFGISNTELLQNMGIFGRSGSGKTNFAFHIIKQLDSQKIPYLFFDNKRTLRHLIPGLKNKVNVYTPGRSLSKLSFNPFVIPPGLENSVYINQLVDVLANAFTLGDGSRSILQKAISACYRQGNHPPLVKDVIMEIEKIESKERVRGWKISALRALETLNFSNITTNRTSQEELMQNLIEGNTIIELDGLGDGARKFLIPILYQWIFQVKLCSPVREKLTMAVFIDEAHLIFDNRSSGTLMERLLRQTRELGIATVVMDQTPSLMSKVVLANCYTNVFLNLVSASDLSKAASVCLLDPDEKKYFSMLPVGQGIIKLQDRWMQPFLVKFPLMDIQKGAVTDEVLLRYFNEISSKTTHSPRKMSVPPAFDGFPRIPFDVILEKPALQMLYDILTHPQDGVRHRYRRLGISDKKGHQTKETLLNQGWIESQTVELGRTRKIILRLTKQAKETLGLDTETPEYGSLVHEYWKRFYGQKLERQGYKIDFEVPRISGRVDVVAKKKDEKLAIEIETGKSNFIRNVQQDLAARYDKIIVVATDKSAFDKIEKKLIEAGLLIPRRVELVLAAK